MLGSSNSDSFCYGPFYRESSETTSQTLFLRTDHTATKHDYPWRLTLPMASFSSWSLSAEARLSCQASFIASSQWQNYSEKISEMLFSRIWFDLLNQEDIHPSPLPSFLVAPSTWWHPGIQTGILYYRQNEGIWKGQRYASLHAGPLGRFQKHWAQLLKPHHVVWTGFRPACLHHGHA